MEIFSPIAEIYTDGSCHTQHCVGAWAAVISVNKQKIVLSGIEYDTTHNRMEILAVIKSIQHIQQNFTFINHLKIISDSQYVIGLADRKAKFTLSDYTTRSGKDIRNADLVKTVLMLFDSVTIELIKIKAHQKPNGATNYNIEADKLSRQLVRDIVTHKQAKF